MQCWRDGSRCRPGLLSPKRRWWDDVDGLVLGEALLLLPRNSATNALLLGTSCCPLFHRLYLLGELRTFEINEFAVALVHASVCWLFLNSLFPK